MIRTWFHFLDKENCRRQAGNRALPRRHRLSHEPLEERRLLAGDTFALAGPPGDVDYDYRDKARNQDGNETGWSPVGSVLSISDNDPLALIDFSPADDATWNFTTFDPANTSVIVYEGFQYSDVGQELNDQPDDAGSPADVDGIGMAGVWADVDAGIGTADDMFLKAESLAFGDLATSGNHIGFNSNLNSDRYHRLLTNDAQLAVAGANEIWFGILVEKLQNNFNAAEGGFVLANQLVGDARILFNDGTDGLSGFGFAPTDAGTNWTPYAWNGSTQLVGDAALQVGIGNGDVHLIVGHISFDTGTDGTDEYTLYDYRLTAGNIEGGTLNPIASTLEVDVDQSLLSTVNLTRQVNLNYDELRIATTLADVINFPDVPNHAPLILADAAGEVTEDATPTSVTASGAIVFTDAVAYYPLNDGESGTDVSNENGGADNLIDSPAHPARDATVEGSGGVWFDDPDRGVVFRTGEDDRLVLGTQGIDRDQGFTWAFWANVASSNIADTGADVIIGTRQGSPWHKLDVQSLSNWAGINYPDGPATFADDTWHHIAYVGDSTSVRLYRDGILVGEDPSTTSMTFDGKFELGGSSQFSEDITGLLSDLSVWNRALSTTEIDDLIAAGTLIPPDDLVFTDNNPNDTHTFSAVYNNDALWSGGTLNAAQIAAISSTTDNFSVDNDSWDYTVANSAIDFLADGETITLSFGVTVTDNSGTANASATRNVTITINGSTNGGGDTLRILNTSLKEGSVEFALSDGIDPSVLNLYDGPDTEADAPDVTVVGQTTGEVAGSLVWDSASKTLTFIKTGGPLLPDTYTLTLAGRADGIVGLDGLPLDGDGDSNPGGDYTEQIVVEQFDAVFLSVTEFARGPDQPVELGGTSGIPVTVQGSDGVSSIRFQVRFNPDLLDISGTNPGADLPGDWQIDFQQPSPGMVEVVANGTELTSELTNLFELVASVPLTAAYRASHVIRVSDIELKNSADESLLARGDQSVHSVVYLGDATGNQDYSGLDASWIARIAVGLDTGLDDLANIDPMIIGDVTGNGEISALDASLVARKAVRLPQTEIPDIPAPVPAPSAVASQVIETAFVIAQLWLPEADWNSQEPAPLITPAAGAGEPTLSSQLASHPVFFSLLFDAERAATRPEVVIPPRPSEDASLEELLDLIADEIHSQWHESSQEGSP